MKNIYGISMRKHCWQFYIFLLTYVSLCLCKFWKGKFKLNSRSHNWCCYILINSTDAFRTCQTSKMKLLVKVISSWKTLTIFANCPILDIWQGFQYASNKQLLITLFLEHVILHKCWIKLYARLRHIFSVSTACRMFDEWKGKSNNYCKLVIAEVAI